MSGIHAAISLAVQIILVGVLVGVFRRRYDRQCVSFVGYVLAIVSCETAIVLWPDRFWNWPFWNFSQGAYAIAKLAIAGELTVRALVAFPGTWRMAAFTHGTVVLVMGVTWTLSTTAPEAFAFSSHPVLAAGTIWLFAATSSVTGWYRVPLHPWHRALLVSFTAYLLVFTAFASIANGRTWWLIPMSSAVDQLAYLLLTLWWAYAAWRPSTSMGGYRPWVQRRLGLGDA